MRTACAVKNYEEAQAFVESMLPVCRFGAITLFPLSKSDI
jgi:hypothetical protein